MLFSGIQLSIIAADHSQHQSGSEVICFFMDGAFEIWTSQDRTIEAKEMFSDEDCKDYICRIKNKRLFEVSNSALGVPFEVEISSGIQQACEEIKVLSSEAAEHVFHTLVERFLFAGLFVVFGDSVAPQGLQLSTFDCASLREVFDQRIQHRVIIQTTCGLPVDEIQNELEAVLCA